MEPRHLPALIATERLELRKHVPGLAATLFAAVDGDRDRLRTYLPWVDAIRTERDEAEYVAMALADWEQHKLFDYGMFTRDGGHFLGNIGVHTIHWQHAVCELGYWIVSAWEGRGFVSEAVRGVEAVCFAEGFERVEIRCSTANARSAAVPGRCGYVLEGCLRSNMSVHGQRADSLVFSRIRGDVGQAAVAETGGGTGSS